MSWKSRSNGNRTKGGNWSGPSVSREQPRHRWQDSSAASQRGGPKSRRPRSRWLILTVLGLALIGSLLYMLSNVQRVTQVILLNATDYPLPIPPNSWAVEDGDALKALEEENLWPVS